jgi:hypothetical protein
MTQPVVNVNVQQAAAFAPVRELLEQEVAVKRIAMNLKRRQERLKRELGG